MRFFALIAVSLVSWCTPIAQAVLHPVLTNPRIVSCEKSPNNGGSMANQPCAANVIYDWGPRVMLDMPETQRPDPNGGTELWAVGIHCAMGSQLTGMPFRYCQWVRPTNHPVNYAHSPKVSNCRLKSTESWELTDDSTCDVRTLHVQTHYGAGPGGECVVFVQKGSKASQGIVVSIHGILDATTVANSGNRYCQKPMPPSIECHLQLPSVIDHGTLGPNSESVKTISGNLDCGERPRVSVVPGNVIELARGVMTEISVRMTNPSTVVVTSNLRTVNGTPGAHTGSLVVLVSPY